MNTDARIEELDDEIDELQKKLVRLGHKRTVANERILKLRAERKKLEYPAESLSDVVTFHKKFGGASSLLYKYAAIKANQRWYLTGALSPQAVTWEGLVDFARRDNVIDPAFTPRYPVPLPTANGIYINTTTSPY